MFLCLFSLISTTSANIFAETRQIAVLRALGFTKFMLKRLYFYETFVLVFTSSILGILIGTFMGWTMTLQQRQFINLPLSGYFPYMQVIFA
mmetsp:Transcript_30935/g.27364  ORF Transcript_30935/g.27364 Transcript_30935/m.27364 type:complete len:91 (+) Transcript_30935:644-916(+)